jgi:hypothetical protein
MASSVRSITPVGNCRPITRSSHRAIRHGNDAANDREYGAFDEIELEPYNYLSEDELTPRLSIPETII